MNIYVICRNDFPWAATPSHEKARKCVEEKNAEEQARADAGLTRRDYFHLMEVEYWGMMEMER